uniref:Uncharacterized protein n=1 Tax=Arundo donax TaxID=35708 RepID=A0A0A9E6N8_ARUDO
MLFLPMNQTPTKLQMMIANLTPNLQFGIPSLLSKHPSLPSEHPHMRKRELIEAPNRLEAETSLLRYILSFPKACKGNVHDNKASPGAKHGQCP